MRSEMRGRCYKVHGDHVQAWVDSGFQRGPNFVFGANDGGLKRKQVAKQKANAHPPAKRAKVAKATVARAKRLSVSQVRSSSMRIDVHARGHYDP